MPILEPSLLIEMKKCKALHILESIRELRSAAKRMFPRNEKAPSKKAMLEKEVASVLETYGKRLLAVRKTMEYSAAPHQLVWQVENIRHENEKARERLRKNIDTASRSSDSNADVLSSVWNITRMKGLYYPVLAEAFQTASLCIRWKNCPRVLDAMERHNQQIFGQGRDDIKNYISIFSYPNIVKDHLFNMRNILEKYNRTTSCSAFKRVAEMICWLDREQPSLTSIKGLDSLTLFNQIWRRDEVVLQRGKMKMPICDSGDASNAELILSESLVAVRTLPRRIFGKGTLESSPTCSVDFEEGDDDLTLHVLGVGFRKVLIADSRDQRDEWLTLFEELKENGIRVSG